MGSCAFARQLVPSRAHMRHFRNPLFEATTPASVFGCLFWCAQHLLSSGGRSEKAGPYFLFAVIAMALATVAASAVSYGEPLAAGSGIPELKTYLNGVHIPGAHTTALPGLATRPGCALHLCMHMVGSAHVSLQICCEVMLLGFESCG